jgi:ADP-ribosylglycohydrolase
MDEIIKECSYNINELNYDDYDLKLRAALMLQCYGDEDVDFDYINSSSSLYFSNKEELTGFDVINHWLNKFSYAMLTPSQQVAYTNYFQGVGISDLATSFNPYREWNGGLIDALTLGLINPADPLKASQLAYVVNYPAHTKNGLYGPMFISGVVAQCFVNTDVIEIVKTGMGVIPHGSRLSESIYEVVESYEHHVNVQKLMRSIRKRYDNASEFGIKHVVPNTMIITLCILYAKSYDEAIKLCVEAGYDVKTNLKVVCSVLGILSYEYINDNLEVNEENINKLIRELGV